MVGSNADRYNTLMWIIRAPAVQCISIDFEKAKMRNSKLIGKSCTTTSRVRELFLGPNRETTYE